MGTSECSTSFSSKYFVNPLFIIVQFIVTYNEVVNEGGKSKQFVVYSLFSIFQK